MKAAYAPGGVLLPNISKVLLTQLLVGNSSLLVSSVYESVTLPSSVSSTTAAFSSLKKCRKSQMPPIATQTMMMAFKMNVTKRYQIHMLIKLSLDITGFLIVQFFEGRFSNLFRL